MRFGTKASSADPDTDPDVSMARILRPVVFIGMAILFIGLTTFFVLDLGLGWLSKARGFLFFEALYSFFIIWFAVITTIQIRHYRRTGQDRFGFFGVSRRAWEVRQIGFLVAMGSFALILFGAPAEIMVPIFIVGFAASIIGFAGIMGSSLGSGFATLGVLLSAGGALYNALAGTDYMKPIIQSVIYAGMGLVAVAMIIFFVRRWRRRNESKGGDDPASPGNQS